MCGTCRREQDRIMANAVTLKRLAQNEAAAEDGVIAHFESGLNRYRHANS
jgi:hypothetical protein